MCKSRALLYSEDLLRGQCLLLGPLLGALAFVAPSSAHCICPKRRLTAVMSVAHCLSEPQFSSSMKWA